MCKATPLNGRTDQGLAWPTPHLHPPKPFPKSFHGKRVDYHLLEVTTRQTPGLHYLFAHIGSPSLRSTFILGCSAPLGYPEPPNFTGRKQERQMLTDWLLEDREHPLLSLVAIGGMGKSPLAWRWLQEDVIEAGIELDGIVWWILDNYINI